MRSVVGISGGGVVGRGGQAGGAFPTVLRFCGFTVSRFGLVNSGYEQSVNRHDNTLYSTLVMLYIVLGHGGKSASIFRDARSGNDQGGSGMTRLRIFVSYESTNAAFATQLTTDLRNAGAEVITDSMEAVEVVQGSDSSPTDLDDTTFEEFLGKELLQCQHLIVIQTPEALQAPRVRAVVESVLKQVQAGQMRAVLRVIAPTLTASCSSLNYPPTCQPLEEPEGQ